MSPISPLELDTTAEALEVEFLETLNLESELALPAQRTSLKKTDAALAAALVTTGVSPLCSMLSFTRKEVISSSPRPLTRIKMDELGSWPGGQRERATSTPAAALGGFPFEIAESGFPQSLAKRRGSLRI